MTALEYHEATKHHFNRFARSTGHMDWATQPDPFRRFAGAPVIVLPREPVAADVRYHALLDGTAPSLPVTAQTVADFLRCAMGLSAWKQYQANRWALRVNPSSGNLHPTETYLVWNGRVHHYAPREHALEQRCAIDRNDAAWSADAGRLAPDDDRFLVGLTSIFWREAWKYGERAFRYCQHDLGHALAALRLSAARLGWTLHLQTNCSDAQTAALLGLDRDEDFVDAEREAPECLALVTTSTSLAGGEPPRALDLETLVMHAGLGAWTGAANRLSRGHVAWPIIDEVASITTYPGSGAWASEPAPVIVNSGFEVHESAAPVADAGALPLARSILLQRRSAVAFDGRSTLAADAFQSMLGRLIPPQSPWDAWPWPAQVHLALFVHRVDGLIPGIYAFLRDPRVASAWQAAMRPQFLWEPSGDASRLAGGALFLLLPFDMIWPATRVSCDQDIAGDGFFSLAMVAPLRSAISARGEWFYRRLFWEAGMIGQVLYLEAEAVGARSTGIGCFYDDAVHELLGLSAAEGNAEWQSLYHFSMGQPVDDGRLTTEPGYEWEKR